jgi:hypothetical protein
MDRGFFATIRSLAYIFSITHSSLSVLVYQRDGITVIYFAADT